MSTTYGFPVTVSVLLAHPVPMLTGRPYRAYGALDTRTEEDHEAFSRALLIRAGMAPRTNRQSPERILEAYRRLRAKELAGRENA